jgi:hypothetical protein
MTRNTASVGLFQPTVRRLFDQLRDPLRCRVLAGLRDGWVETEADVLARGDGGEAELIAFRHNHLPKLADGGYVEWDRETGAISKGPRYDEAERLFRLFETHADELLSD